MEEIWKEIKGYEGYYKVSNFGNVKSLRRKIMTSKGHYHTVNSRVMVLKKDTNGYSSVILSKNQITNQFRVHRLVADAFIPNVENLKCVNHIDGNKKNNKVENLEWVTHSENSRHSVKIGLTQKKDNSGVNNPRSRVNDSIVILIRNDFNNGLSHGELMKKYNLPSSTISNIKLKKTWTHV